MPEIIQTRDTKEINLTLTIVNLVSLSIWILYALLILEPYMLLSNGLGWLCNGIQVMFFYWAKGRLNGVDAPRSYRVMHFLLKFFSLFAVQQQFKEIQRFFWHDESTEFAQAHIKQYKDDIQALEEKYDGREKSFDEHISDMRSINRNLETISRGRLGGEEEGRGGCGQSREESKKQCKQPSRCHYNSKQFKNRK